MDRGLRYSFLMWAAAVFFMTGAATSGADQLSPSDYLNVAPSAAAASTGNAPAVNKSSAPKEKNPAAAKKAWAAKASPSSKEDELSAQIISPDSGQTQASAQKVTVSGAQRISLDYTNANLTDVLKAIAYSYNINIIITKDLKGKISAKLKDFTLDDALDAILTVHKYGFMRKGGIVYVVPKEDLDQLTESLPLSFITTKEAVKLLEGTKVKFSGNIQENQDSNTLIVTATPSDMQMIKQYLKGIDVPPIEVMIDAQLVSITKQDSKNIGATINVNYNPERGVGVTLLEGNSGVSSAGSTSAASTTAAQTGTVTGTNNYGSLLTNAVQGIGSGSAAGVFGLSGIKKYVSPSVAISALVTQNKARVIASPSIATLNGHEASILIGDHYPYVSSTSTAGGASGSVVNQTQTQYVDIGTKLKVTPIVSPDGWITLKVEPEVSSLNGLVNGNPDISTSSAKTEVRVRDNQTIVIGGLDSRNVNNTRSGTPGLMSIPVLGWLFKQDTNAIKDGTLTVLITPHIVSMSSPENKTSPVSASFFKGEDSGMINGLLQYADELEQDKTRDTAKNLYISEEQIKTYRKILEQFPQSGKTDFSLYKIAFIYGKDFGNCSAAKEALTEMKDFCPTSPYIKVTELFVNACMDVGSQ